MLFNSLLRSFAIAAIGLTIVYASPSIATTQNKELPKIQVGDFALSTANNLLKQKKYNQALVAINQLLATKPKFIEARVLRGQILLVLKKNAQVITEMTAVLIDSPNYVSAYNLRGQAFYQNSQYEVALEDFNTAINLEHNFVQALLNRSVLFIELGQYQNAALDLDKILELEPTYYQALVARQKLRNKLEYLIELNTLNKLIDSDPHNPNNYYTRAVYYFNHKSYDKVVDDASKAIELNPLFAEAYYIRGAALYNLGNLHKARADFLKSTQYLGNQPTSEG
jgi:tetratricopeptide (TPR) repeat protein